MESCLCQGQVELTRGNIRAKAGRTWRAGAARWSGGPAARSRGCSSACCLPMTAPPPAAPRCAYAPARKTNSFKRTTCARQYRGCCAGDSCQSCMYSHLVPARAPRPLLLRRPPLPGTVRGRRPRLAIRRRKARPASREPWPGSTPPPTPVRPSLAAAHLTQPARQGHAALKNVHVQQPCTAASAGSTAAHWVLQLRPCKLSSASTYTLVTDCQ